MTYTAAQYSEIARQARCSRQTAIDYLTGARRTSPAIASAIDLAVAHVLSAKDGGPPESETILALNDEPLDGAIRVYGAATAFDARAAFDPHAEGSAAKEAADLLIAAVRNAVRQGFAVEDAARMIVKAAREAEQKDQATAANQTRNEIAAEVIAELRAELKQLQSR